MQRTNPRRLVFRLLVLAAGVSLLLSILLIWAQRSFFDSAGFASRSSAALREPAVQDRMAAVITERLVDDRPALQAARADVQAAVNSAVSAVVHEERLTDAVRALHQRLFDSGKGSLLLTLAQIAGRARALLEPELAAQLPEELPEVEMAIVKARDVRVRLLRLAHGVEFIAVALPVLSLVCFAGFVWIAEDRRGALLTGVRTVEIVAGLLLAMAIAGGELTGALAADENARAVKAVWWAFVGALAAGSAVAFVLAITLSLAVVVLARLRKGSRAN